MQVNQAFFEIKNAKSSTLIISMTNGDYVTILVAKGVQYKVPYRVYDAVFFSVVDFM